MRHLIFILVLFPVVVFAQGQPGMPPNMLQMDMEKMQRAMQQVDMGKMQEAMACMKNIDMAALAEEGKKIEAELGALCENGNRDGVQDKAMGYAKEMRSRPELQKMQECGKMAEGMLPKGAFEDLLEEEKNRHVCDDF